MADQWFYAKGKQAHGPVAAAELKRLASTGGLSPDDLVRKAGMTQWVRASSVKQLFQSQSVPAPPVAESSLTTQATKNADTGSHVAPGPADVFVNNCHQLLQDWTARGGAWGPFWNRMCCFVEWFQMLAGTRLPDGSKRAPTRAFFTVCLLGCLGAAIGAAGIAIEGVASDTKKEYSVGYEHVRDGNRINLNQVEEKVRLHEYTVKRKMTPLEKGGCYVVSGAFALGAFWYAWRLVSYRSRDAS